jgi:hypothetical protein
MNTGGMLSLFPTFDPNLCKQGPVPQGMSVYISSGLWIRIRTGSGFNESLDPDLGPRGEKRRIGKK